jgi:hypothetical protein
VFCAEASMGVSRREKRKASRTAGDRCTSAGQSLDDFGGKPGHEWVGVRCRWPGKCSQRNSQDPGVHIGKDCWANSAKRCRQSGTCSCWLIGVVRTLTVGRDCRVGLASVFTDQCGIQSPCAERGELCMDQSLGTHTRNEVAGQNGMLCPQKRTGEWNLADATSSPAMRQHGSS